MVGGSKRQFIQAGLMLFAMGVVLRRTWTIVLDDNSGPWVVTVVMSAFRAVGLLAWSRWMG